MAGCGAAGPFRFESTGLGAGLSGAATGLGARLLVAAGCESGLPSAAAEAAGGSLSGTAKGV